MNSIISNSSGTTKNCEAFFNKFSEGFGNVVEAIMKGSSEPVDYELTLVNDKGESMILSGGLTAGYVGAGSNGTIRVLKKVGFDIDENFVYSNQSFHLKK